MMSTMRLTAVSYYCNHDELGQRVQYYEDSASGIAGERMRWYVPPPHTSVVVGVLAYARDGEDVLPADLEALAAGRHPSTGQLLAARGGHGGGKPRVGQDLCFSAVKGVSCLFAVGDAAMRREIREAQDAAVRRAMRFAHDEGLFRCRRGKDGVRSEPALHYVAAVVEHSASRALDPQIHTHVVVPATATRADGTTSCLDFGEVLRHQGALAAVFRAELAAQLRSRLGVEAVRDGRNFALAGMPAEVAELFSKRRAAIEAAADEHGFDTAVDRKRAQLAALDTRAAKDRRVSPEELEAGWTAELEAAGFERAAVVSAVTQASADLAARRREGFDPAMSDADLRASAVRAAVGAAVVAMTEHYAVVSRRDVLRHVVEAMQGVADADEALAAVESVIASGDLVEIGKDADGRALYSVPAIVAAERDVLKFSVGRLGEREFAPPHVVEAAIRVKSSLTAEQRAAVRHALNRDGVSVVEGTAGSGKSFASDAVTKAAAAAGLTVHLIAPSWAAVSVAAAENEAVAAEMARAVSGFLLRAEKGEIDLSGALILVDEAGMIGTRDMARLLAAAAGAGAKVVLTGDSRQLQPVASGAPMRAVAARCGTQRIGEEIRRQKSDWMKVATKDFARGRAGAAILAYDGRDCIRWASDRDDAMARLAADWRRDVDCHADDPDWTRLVVAQRNADVRRLNGMLRAEWADAGRLSGKEFVVRAVPRGRDSAPVEMRLRAGDRIVFGERVEIAGRPVVNNSDFSTVLAVGGDDLDPTVSVRLDKGGVWTGRWSELVGKRPKGEAGPAVPKIQHAFAGTVHQSQGKSVSSAFVLNCAAGGGPGGGRGMGAEAAYVAMTRHKSSARMYVAADTLLDRLPADDKPLPDVADEAACIRAFLRNELGADCGRSEGKANVTDFVADIDEFIRTGDPRAVPSPARLIETRMAARRKNPMPAPTANAWRSAGRLAENGGFGAACDRLRSLGHKLAATVRLVVTAVLSPALTPVTPAAGLSDWLDDLPDAPPPTTRPSSNSTPVLMPSSPCPAATVPASEWAWLDGIDANRMPEIPGPQIDHGVAARLRRLDAANGHPLKMAAPEWLP